MEGGFEEGRLYLLAIFVIAQRVYSYREFYFTNISKGLTKDKIYDIVAKILLSNTLYNRDSILEEH